jgi:hypothetical protein
MGFGVASVDAARMQEGSLPCPHCGAEVAFIGGSHGLAKRRKSLGV